MIWVYCIYQWAQLKTVGAGIPPPLIVFIAGISKKLTNTMSYCTNILYNNSCFRRKKTTNFGIRIAYKFLPVANRSIVIYTAMHKYHDDDTYLKLNQPRQRNLLIKPNHEFDGQDIIFLNNNFYTIMWLTNKILRSLKNRTV